MTKAGAVQEGLADFLPFSYNRTQKSEYVQEIIGVMGLFQSCKICVDLGRLGVRFF